MTQYAEGEHPQYKQGMEWTNSQSGKPADYRKAARCFLLGAWEGDRPSQIKIAEMYLAGTGVVFSIVRAFAWLSVACVAKNEQEVLDLKKSEKEKSFGTAIREATKLRAEIWKNHNFGYTKTMELSARIQEKILRKMISIDDLER